MAARYWSGMFRSKFGKFGFVTCASDGMSVLAVYVPSGWLSGPLAVPSSTSESCSQLAQLPAAVPLPLASVNLSTCSPQLATVLPWDSASSQIQPDFAFDIGSPVWYERVDRKSTRLN